MDINDYTFQLRILILMVVHEEFLHRFRAPLSADLFDHEDNRVVAATILDYYDAYHKPPDFEIVKFCLNRDVQEQPYTTETWDEFVDGMETLAKQGGLKFVYDRTEQFIKHKQLATALSTAVGHWEDKNHDLALRAIRDFERRQVLPSDGINFFENLYERVMRKDVRDTIPTGIVPLDRAMVGGTGRSELTVILAPPGGGKTMMLINLGAAAVIEGLRVYHFFAEQTEELIWQRYAMRLAHASKVDLLRKPKKYAWRLQQVEKKKGFLKIVGCLGWQVEQIRSYIYRHGHPDAIVVDYADKLIPSHRYSEMRHEVSRIYDELSNMGKEFHCAVWTASQTTRKALGKQKVTIRDFAESWDKAAIADNVLALPQTEKERAHNRFRIYLAKIRNEEGFKEIKCRIVYRQMRVLPFQQVRFGGSKAAAQLAEGNSDE